MRRTSLGVRVKLDGLTERRVLVRHLEERQLLHRRLTVALADGLDDRLRVDPLVDVERDGGHLEAGMLGPAGPVQKRLPETLELVHRVAQVTDGRQDGAVTGAKLLRLGERVGRRTELLTLTWDRVCLDGDEPEVHFARTKSYKDRLVPINPDVVTVLRRLQAMTLQQGGPFVGMGDNLGCMWGRIVKKAGVSPITIHDLRRTYVTRMVRAGTPLPNVQKLAGHADIQTTLRYYNWASDHDLRQAVKMLKKDVG